MNFLTICHPTLVFVPPLVFGSSAQIAKFMGPTWVPPGSCRPQMGPMLAPWTLLSGRVRQISTVSGEQAVMPVIFAFDRTASTLIQLWHNVISDTNIYHKMLSLCNYQQISSEPMLYVISLICLVHQINRMLWPLHHVHYNDVTMGTMASQITRLTIVYSIVYSVADRRKHQSSASLAFVWGIHRLPVNSPHKWPVTRKMFPFDDVCMHILLLNECLTSGKLEVWITTCRNHQAYVSFSN